MSAESRVGFFRSGFTVAVLKRAGIMPEVREEMIRVLRNGRMSERCFGEGGRESGPGNRWWHG